jgi:hypothetical protein
MWRCDRRRKTEDGKDGKTDSDGKDGIRRNADGKTGWKTGRREDGKTGRWKTGRRDRRGEDRKTRRGDHCGCLSAGYHILTQLQ